MARFKDTKDREWDITLDVLQLKAVRERLQFKLGDILSNNMAGLQQLATDPELLVNVLWVLCEKQARERGVTAESFGQSLTGDAIEAGFECLMGAYADFCPSRQAKPLRALLAKNHEIAAAATDKALAAISRLTPESIWNGLPGSAAESAESTPAPVG